MHTLQWLSKRCGKLIQNLRWLCEDPAISYLFKSYTFAVTLCCTLRKEDKGKGSTMKEEKSVKTKECLFTLTNDNYILFLQSILKKQGYDNYKVSERK